MNYYLVEQDNSVTNRWCLGDIKFIDNWLFKTPSAEIMEPGHYELDAEEVGYEHDFSLAGYASVPVVSEKFVLTLRGIPEVDKPHFYTVFQPVSIYSFETNSKYFLLVTETIIDCVDETRSEFEKFSENDPIRPDKAGDYRCFTSLVLDHSKVQGSHIFRIKGYSSALIVSEIVKERLENGDISGATFSDVNGSAKTVC